MRHVLAYLQARNEWERDAFQRYKNEGTRHLKQVLDEIHQGYDALLARYCTPKVLARRANSSFGKPPSVDPALTRFRGVRLSRGTAVVVTHEDTKVPGGRQFDLIVEYEYVLRGSGTDWLIDDRRSRDSDGRWIRSIL